MRITPTYQYYVDTFHGTLDEDTFFENVVSAAALVNDLIGLNVVTERTEAAYKNAVCSAVERMTECGGGESMSIGSFSIGGTGNSGEQSARAAAVLHLSGTGLLWAGV